MLGHILVPLDGSAFAEFALPPALALARRAGARIELLTVTDAEPDDPGSLGAAFWTEETAGRYLEKVGSELRARWEGPLERSIRRGYPAARIEARAREAPADLVVLSSHGRGPFSRFWLGSVTDMLIRRALCPTLVVRPEEGAEPALDAGFRAERILVPVDRSDVSRSIVERAVEIGRHFDARFHLVTCVRTLPFGAGDVHPYLTRPSGIDESRAREEARTGRERLETLAERLRAREVEAEISVVRGESVPDSILQTATDWGADLIAMGTRGRGGVQRTVLGSVADKVIRAARLPVLASRPSEPQ